ncbi:hypothetical protein [Cryptosporangium arvum]|uniref:Uncharacterized protein n=1 Tax=Cryptosporangium arvum DSM 44712 TaxID=927661 RepID=A0A010YVK0_9ACTN|nr:hypothetical protein [Cryptosporangium arvum]EXG79168.1 hypothetical protein CryarDRAFT_0194 [Cryptosporangium arvum DSM 44712]
MSTALVLALALIILTLGYLGLCRFWPYTHCRRCDGTGKRHALIGRGYRHCPRCGGTGERLRIGRHVLNHLTALHRASR